MNSNFLIYYLFRLIKDGHEWQYKNLNGTGKRPRFYFSFLQIIALFISVLFVINEPDGLSSSAKDYILGCLSIMVALFLSLILVVFDKSKPLVMEDDKKVTRIHSWNFFYQFNALTSYAILVALVVIIFTIIELVFNISFNLSDYYFVPYYTWNFNAVILFIKGCIVAFMRLCVIYFLIDFFIICLYAICSIYQYMRLDFLKRKPDIQIYNEESIEATFEREYGLKINRIKCLVLLVLFVMVVFWVYNSIH